MAGFPPRLILLFPEPTSCVQQPAMGSCRPPAMSPSTLREVSEFQKLRLIIMAFSYGFRPRRSLHQALDGLYVAVTRKKVFLDVGLRRQGLFRLCPSYLNGRTWHLPVFREFVSLAFAALHMVADYIVGVFEVSCRTPAARFLWARLCEVWNDWRSSLVIVKPDTVIAWHRKSFRLFWTLISRRG